MTLWQTPIAKLQETQAVLGGRDARQESTFANVAEVDTYHDPGLLLYRDRPYDVRFVPFRATMKLLALDQELRRLAAEEATPEILQRSIGVTAELLAIVTDYLRPHHWWHRFGDWRGEIMDAEVEEVNAFRHFFCSARMKCPVVGVRSIRAPRWLQQTWPPSWPVLRVGMAAGWSATPSPVPPSPAAGDTSSPGTPVSTLMESVG